MSKTLDMSNFDEFEDNLEEFINKQGYTLGDKAEMLQKLLFSIQYCYIHGVVTDSQAKKMNEKFNKQFKQALLKL